MSMSDDLVTYPGLFRVKLLELLARALQRQSTAAEAVEVLRMLGCPDNASVSEIKAALQHALEVIYSD